ncbi:nitroreductase family deazaflavin-dependent oxidoreductase [Actinoplanes sp. ATCC 53533]|uniref:nitroreductase/quinone reductase family protein n=1 Tax=Actinoplanes sp. ATCC 53533 TaxID=1288362 RepID=UPI000F795ABC|nr:nitroreductase/quinone reductase family protein [Actinoplanes sp. ATCC 53533]RSM53336.1 nitroreductase family deazaflavin-dependent oxidoreductase [Actinoplanes sp. ATCC 53533]
MSDWNTTIIEQFRARGGKGVAQFGDALLLLHHTGARTGTVRVNPLAYYDDGDRLVIAASKAGAPQHPDWFFNLRANPDTTIELGSETLKVRAAEITGDDYEQTWARVIAAMPGFAGYQAKTTRRIPLIALDRKDG